MEKNVSFLRNPFRKIAGGTALLWGAAGLVVATLLNYFSDYHYHGLLHYGPAPEGAFYVYAAEQLIAWLVPATVIFIGGLIISRSRVRAVDVYGTFAFSMLPLLLLSVWNYLPPMQRLLEVTPEGSIDEMIALFADPLVAFSILFELVFLVWAVLWMFQAVKVSCNLKGWRLALLFILGVFGGDLLTRPLIAMFY